MSKSNYDFSDYVILDNGKDIALCIKEFGENSPLESIRTTDILLSQTDLRITINATIQINIKDLTETAINKIKEKKQFVLAEVNQKREFGKIYRLNVDEVATDA